MSTFRISRTINAAVIFILLITVITPTQAPSAAPAQLPGATNSRTNDAQSPIQARLTIDHYPTVGEAAQLTCIITTVAEAPGSTAKIELPAGARLLEGDLTWSGDLHPGQPVQLTLRVAFDQAGDTAVFCRAHYQVDDQNSWGGLGQLYFTTGSTHSAEGFAATSLQGRVRNGAQRQAGNGTPIDNAKIPSYAPDLSAPPPPSVDATLTKPVQPASVNVPQGDLTVTGSWHYFDRNGDYVPADQMLVELVNGFGAHLAWCFTSLDGNYSCGPVANPGSDGVRTYIRSWTNFNPYHDILGVENPDWSTATPTDINSTFAVQSGVETFPDGTGDLGEWFVTQGDTYTRAYWITADLINAWKYVYFGPGINQSPVETTGPGSVVWKIDSTDGTYYNNGGNIHLTGADPLSNTTVDHEYGHNVMYNVYGKWFPYNDCPSPHYVQYASGVDCGWTEGWADFFPLAINNDPVYRWADGGALNLETPTWGTSTWQNGDWSEGRVAGALWDILDTANDGDDTYSDGSFDNIWDTLYHHTRDSTFSSFWAGWLARGHNNTSAGPIMDLYQNTINYRSGPPNDDFVYSHVLSNTTTNLFESTVNATTQGLDPTMPAGCGSSTVPRQARSVWFTFNPAVSRQYFINTLTSNYDTVLAIWTGSWGSLVSVDCNNDLDGTTQSALTAGLANGTYYYIEAMGYGSIDMGGTLNFAVCYAPDIPTLLLPGANTYSADNTPAFSWSAGFAPDQSEIQIATQSNMNGMVTDITTTGSFYTPAAALADGNYYWRVRGQYTSSCANDGTWSAIRHLVVDTVKPTGSISINSGATYTNSTAVTLDLSSTDTGSGVYRMHIGNEGASYQPWEAYAATKSWSLPTGDGTKKIWAQYEDHAINLSPQYSDTIILDTVAPTNPTLATETGGTASNIWQKTVSDPAFTWSGASDATSGVAGYYVYWGTDPAGTGATWTATAGFNPPTVTNPSLNYLRVRTRDKAGNLAAWVTLFTFKYDAAPPTNPLLASSSHTVGVWSGDNTVAVNWSGASDGSGSGIHGYSVQWSQSPTTIPDAVEDTTSTTNTSPALTTGKQWYVHVRTRDNAANWSPAAAHLGPFWIDVTDPTNPTAASELGGATSNTWQNTVPDPNFTWSGASDAASGVAAYYVYWGMDPAGTSTTTGTVSAAFNPLAVANPSVNYLRVRTKDKAGNAADWVTLFTFKYDGKPPVTTMNHLPAKTSAAEIKLNWSAVDPAPGSGVVSYDVQYRIGATGPWVNWLMGTTTTSATFGPFLPVPLVWGQTYYFQVRARDAAGNVEAFPGGSTFTLVQFTRIFLPIVVK